MALCYEYDHVSNKSIGKQYCTADQCHGFKIPIHIKENGKFIPKDFCPPSGCLYCKEAIESPPCGSAFLQRATALQPSDYNKELI
jgi:hypothetical protein